MPVAGARSRLRGSSLLRGALPLGLPYTLPRAPRRRRAPVTWLVRGAHSLPTPRIISPPRGLAPRTPLHAPSRAASPARSGHVARSRCSLAPTRILDDDSYDIASCRWPEHVADSADHLSSEGPCPSDSPTPSLARRVAGALRSRGSFAMLTRSTGMPDDRYDIASC